MSRQAWINLDLKHIFPLLTLTASSKMHLPGCSQAVSEDKKMKKCHSHALRPMWIAPVFPRLKSGSVRATDVQMTHMVAHSMQNPCQLWDVYVSASCLLEGRWRYRWSSLGLASLGCVAGAAAVVMPEARKGAHWGCSAMRRMMLMVVMMHPIAHETLKLRATWHPQKQD